ncbi:LPS-assembly lipoprotein [Faunimonas pinastri]|uniref:LPS-assembly lipoprotein n=1 Tax=Faunimonas pinastri TaxID=1855383 RepID=A0A1H9GVD0_9HYPH|nr:hypothetical protein [Faunimonas pinastri]SEQ54037.1 LPS-assembly lipoprotein [Faunimonas pinastri]
MSWRNAKWAVPALCLMVALGGCQVRPLYAAGPDGKSGAAANMPAIQVDAPGNRVEQVFRNTLLFGIRGGAEAPETRYHMTYQLNLHEQDAAVAPVTGTASVVLIIGELSFLVEDKQTNKALIADHVTTQTSYNHSSQSFANARADKDAQERAAAALASLAQVRIAAYFATHGG